MKKFIQANKEAADEKSEAKEELVTEKANEEAAPEDVIKEAAEEDVIKEAVEDEAAPEDVIKEAVEEDVIKEATTDEQVEAAVANTTDLASSIMELCIDAGAAAMAPDLLKRKITLDQAKIEVDKAGKIMGFCEMAKRPDLADSFIKSEMSVEDVQAKLIETLAEADDEIQVSNKVDANAIDNTEVKSYANGESKSNLLMLDAEKRAERK